MSIKREIFLFVRGRTVHGNEHVTLLNDGAVMLFSNRFIFPRMLCGARIRVEMSNGMSRKSRFGRPSRRQFDPNDRCYQCGETGHYAYDCYRYNKRGGRRSRYACAHTHTHPSNPVSGTHTHTHTFNISSNKY